MVYTEYFVDITDCVRFAPRFWWEDRVRHLGLIMATNRDEVVNRIVIRGFDPDHAQKLISAFFARWPDLKDEFPQLKKQIAEEEGE